LKSVAFGQVQTAWEVEGLLALVTVQFAVAGFWLSLENL